MKTTTLFLIFAVLFFVFFDMISTLVAYNYLGSFEYEKSNILKAAFGAYGAIGFVIAKGVIGCITLGAAYIVAVCDHRLESFMNGILLGAGLSGLYVGLSNFNIIFSGHSFWIFGIDAGTMAAAILIGTLFVYVLYKVMRIPAYNEA